MELFRTATVLEGMNHLEDAAFRSVYGKNDFDKVFKNLAIKRYRSKNNFVKPSK